LRAVITPLLLAPSLLLAACAKSTPAEAPAPVEPEVAVPDTRLSDSVLTLHGTEVPDPYDWLEDLDDDEVVAWVQAQNTAARGHLDTLPGREALSARLSALWEHDGHGTPELEADRVFATFRAAGADQAVLRVQDAPGSDPRVLLDPNTWSEDGTVALAGWSPSPDGAHVAYGTADAGSDWNTWHVVGVDDGTVLDDELSWVKFSGASWLPDGSGFFYSRFPAPETGAYEEKLSDQQVWFHRVGTPQSDDIRVLATPEHPLWGFWAGVDDEGTRLLVHVSEGTDERNRLWTMDLADLDLDTAGAALDITPRPLRDGFDAEWLPLGTVGDRLYVVTDKEAPKRRVVVMDLSETGEPEAIEIVAERTDATLERALLAGGHLVISWLVDARSEVSVHALDGTKVHDVALPGLGTVSGWRGDVDEDLAYFRFEGFTTPDTIFGLDPATGDVMVEQPPALEVDPDAFVTEQVFYTSKDGTKVPMFLVRRKDVQPTGDVPTLLYGYGGFDISITPSFKTENLVWVEQGGLFVVANLRGGGEYGRDWHAQGTRTRKQNVFDDFIGAAEHLIASGWTSSSHLAIHGRSNGGLLVGATVTQRPDLFAAAVPGVGVLDMLKYHTWTIGWAWASDYGTVEESKDMFDALLAYSPVHNATPQAYPPTLIMTADHDDRVVPAHSYKFGAALQKAQTGTSPVVLRVETRAGHGAGMPVSMKIEESVDRLSFIAAHTGLAVE